MNESIHSFRLAKDRLEAAQCRVKEIVASRGPNESPRESIARASALDDLRAANASFERCCEQLEPSQREELSISIAGQC